MAMAKGRRATALTVCGLGMCLLAGCARPHETEDERLRRQAAEDTRQIRHDAQNAGIEAQKAAEQARRQARDIVAGVREGWQEGGADHAARLDLNTASVPELAGLPGVNAIVARRIAKHRPYDAPRDLVTRGVLTQAEFDRLSGRVTVHGR